MTFTAENIIKEQGRLEPERKRYEALKQLCTQLSYPGRCDQWSLYGENYDKEGKPNTTGRKIYDPTAIKGLEIWSNGIMGHYAPRAVNWFIGGMADRKLKDSKNIIEWLQDTDEHQRSVVNASSPGYYDAKLIKLRDGGAIGDAAMFIDEDEETNKQMMVCPHPRELWFMRDFWGRIIGIHHKYKKTIKQLADEFKLPGDNPLNEEQKLQLEKSPDLKVDCIRAVYKNRDFDPDKIGVKNMPWQHIYVNVQAKQIMRETGTYTINPVPWSLNQPSHEVYGRGVVAQMLLEILNANLVTHGVQTASQQAIQPSMLISSGVKHKRNLLTPGVATFVSSRDMQGVKMGDMMARLVDSSGYPFGVDNQQFWQQMVEDRFGISLFLALNMASAQGYKNIEHIRGAQAERAVLMSPFLSTLSADTDGELDRVYSIELEAGRAPEPPQEVLDAQNGRIDIQYIGPLNQILQSYYETTNLLNTIASIQQVLTISPDSAVVVEGDELMRKILRAGNTPEELILTQEEVMEIKAIAAQAEEAKMQAALAEQTSKAASNLSKKVEDGSVLSELAGVT